MRKSGTLVKEIFVSKAKLYRNVLLRLVSFTQIWMVKGYTKLDDS